MLVLTRSDDEAVVIKVGNVRIVVRVKTQRAKGKDPIRLAFDAPPEARILRAELEEREQ